MIQLIKSSFKKGFARPNLFYVDLGHQKAENMPLYRMRCFQAQIPGNNIATTDKDIGFRSIAYQKIYQDIILGFYISSDLRELKFFQDWIDFIVDKNTNHYRLPNTYQSFLKVTTINRTGNNSGQWRFNEAYPKQIDPISLDFGTNDAIMTANVTFTYRDYEHKYLTDNGQNSDEVTRDNQARSDFSKLESTIKAVADQTVSNAQHFFTTRTDSDFSPNPQNNIGGAINMVVDTDDLEF